LSSADRKRRLVAFLVFDPRVVVTAVGDREIVVSFLGSLNCWAQPRELELHGWRATVGGPPGPSLARARPLLCFAARSVESVDGDIVELD
jgi:hypothetical protein